MATISSNSSSHNTVESNQQPASASRNTTNLSINVASANHQQPQQQQQQVDTDITNPNLPTPNIPHQGLLDQDPILTPPTAIQSQFSGNQHQHHHHHTSHHNHRHHDHAAATANAVAAAAKSFEDEVPKRNKNGTYSIRLTPYVDSNSTSSALYFGPIVRKLKPGNTLPIGRYTEKTKEALTASANSSSPVVFKSKVVSRTHAEIGVDDDGNWYLRDLKSSSGTFLNHRRLSSANQESELFHFKEGDLLQLGMDFRGGTEEIYRCVKMRIELNKSWIRKTKAFSKEAHERIKQLNPDLQSKDQIQCVICLDDIKPCQAVFISPCSHSYHYKCIRRVIFKTYPQFLCPTCRALSDLEVDEDESDSEAENDDDDDDDNTTTDNNNGNHSDDASFRSGISDLEATTH